MPHTALHISNRLLRFFSVLLLMCCLSVADLGIQAQACGLDESVKKKCLAEHDELQQHILQERQMPPAGALITTKTGHRLGSSRPVRLYSSNGGKPGRILGRWTSDHSYQLSKYFALLHRMDCGLRVVAASPRFYYVIALRRILC